MVVNALLERRLCLIMDGEFIFASFLLGIRSNQHRIKSAYLWYTLNIYRREGRYEQFMRQNINGLFNREELKIVKIPLPPIDVQQKIVATIEAERKMVDKCRELAVLYEQKIRRLVEGVWG